MTTKTEIFIEKSKKVHGEQYDYSLTEYVGCMKLVKIICPIHGEFEITANKHLIGRGCNICGRLRIYESKKSNSNKFIEKAKKVHGEQYDYSLVDYIKSNIKVKIICKIHGEFEQTPNNHLKERGCPICKLSRGENKIKQHLEKNNIINFSEYRFKDCKNKYPLPFDFYLPEHNICIEYDGKQHFTNTGWSSSKAKSLQEFENLKTNDKIKDEYCKNNNIRLIRIPYWEYDNIENIIKTIS